MDSTSKRKLTKIMLYTSTNASSKTTL